MSQMCIRDSVKADVFTPGDKIDVTGKSKGKGTAGVIKRWNFHRLKESHGTGPCVRHGGSIGACSSPSRVWKGKRMACLLYTSDVYKRQIQGRRQKEKAVSDSYLCA